MLILNPDRVEFGSLNLQRIASVHIDRATVSPVEQWGAGLPWCRFVDSTKRRTTITLRQEMGGGAFEPEPALGTQAELTMTLTPTRSDRARRRIRSTSVVTGVRYEVSTGRPPLRILTLLAVSTGAGAGATDPVTVEEAPL